MMASATAALGAQSDTQGPSSQSMSKPSSPLSNDGITGLSIDSETPTQDDICRYHGAFEKLRNTILGETARAVDNGHAITAYSATVRGVSLLIVPVGPYALGVWHARSDIDCLCIGSFSSSTFYTLARGRLRRATDPEIRILRCDPLGTKSMFEIELLGLKVNIQYCQTRAAESY